MTPPPPPPEHELKIRIAGLQPIYRDVNDKDVAAISFNLPYSWKCAQEDISEILQKVAEFENTFRTRPYTLCMSKFLLLPPKFVQVYKTSRERSV